MMDAFFKSLDVTQSQLIDCANQTLYMVFVSLVLGSLIGIVLSLILVLSRKGGIKENKYVFFIVNTFINIVRSIPFIILPFKYICAIKIFQFFVRFKRIVICD